MTENNGKASNVPCRWWDHPEAAPVLLVASANKKQEERSGAMITLQALLAGLLPLHHLKPKFPGRADGMPEAGQPRQRHNLGVSAPWRRESCKRKCVSPSCASTPTGKTQTQAHVYMHEGGREGEVCKCVRALSFKRNNGLQQKGTKAHFKGLISTDSDLCRHFIFIFPSVNRKPLLGLT